MLNDKESCNNNEDKNFPIHKNDISCWPSDGHVQNMFQS